jgi:hypothetical protein
MANQSTGKAATNAGNATFAGAVSSLFAQSLDPSQYQSIADALRRTARWSPQSFIQHFMGILRLEQKSSITRHRIIRILDRPTQPNSWVEAVILAAAICGFNGRGKNGLLGYLRMLAQRFPRQYAKLLLAILRDQEWQKIRAVKKERKEYDRWRRAVARPNARLHLLKPPTPHGTIEVAVGALAEAVLSAAAKVGSDGRGNRGLSGYFRIYACRHVPVFLRFLMVIMDFEARFQNTPRVQHVLITESMIRKVLKLSPEECEDPAKVRACFGLKPAISI